MLFLTKYLNINTVTMLYFDNSCLIRISNVDVTHWLEKLNVMQLKKQKKTSHITIS